MARYRRSRGSGQGNMKRVLFTALAMVFALVGLTVWLNVAQSVIPDASEAYYNLANGYNSTAIGASANSLATSSTSWLGYLWVILPFAAAAGMIIYAFKTR